MLYELRVVLLLDSRSHRAGVHSKRNRFPSKHNAKRGTRYNEEDYSKG